jgi:hypothetical protein
MNWRTTVALFAVVVILGAVVYSLSQQEPAIPEVEGTVTPVPTPQTNLVQDVTINDVQRLEIRRFEDETQVVFTREEDGSWFQIVPTNTMVISGTMISEVTRILNMTSQSILSAEANALSAYGLDNPQYEIVLVGRREENNVRFTFLVGNQTPTGDRYYLLRQGDPRIHVVLSSTLDSMIGLLDDSPISPPTPIGTPTIPISGG